MDRQNLRVGGPRGTPRRRPRTWWRGLLLTAVATGGMVGVTTPAEAHNSLSVATGIAYNDGAQCITVGDTQNHGGSLPAQKARTEARHSSGSSCPNEWWLEKNNIAQRGEIWKTRAWGQPGDPCIYGGWQYNVWQDWVLEWQGWDLLANQCNYGSGVPVWVTHDVWHDIRTPGIPWVGNAIRPATRHCYSPNDRCP